MINKFQLAGAIDALIKPEVRDAQKILRFGDHAGYEAIKRFQDESCQTLVRYVFENIPYYRDVMNASGLRPQDIKKVEDIAFFPPLTKEIIRTEKERLRPHNLKPGSYIIRRSGGTTGEPIASFVNKKAAALETYSYFRGLQWMGWNPAHKRVLLTGGSLGLVNTTSLRFKLKSYATGIVALPAFELKRENLYTYIAAIRNAGSCIVTGYASVLKYISDLCRETGETFDNVKGVFSTAEVLPDEWASSIAEVFLCEVKSYYGCGEINSVGYQLTQGGHYQVPDEHVWVECSQGDSRVEDESMLITSFFNFAQPLIRYANGDLGKISRASAGNKRSMITELMGRTADMFTRPDGTKLSSSFGPHSVFRGNIRVKKYQYVQRSLTAIEFRYDPILDDISEDEKEKIRFMIRKTMGEGVCVNFIKTTEFIVSKNLKHRIMVSALG